MSYATLAAEPYSPPVLPAGTVLPPAPGSSSDAASSSAGASGPKLWSHGSFSFKDLLDIVNPLQHIPVVGSIYRYLTGDEPSGGARIVGDSIYGGPIGFGVSAVSTALLTNSKGEDLGERLLADVFGPRDGATTLSTPKVASATPTSAPASATPMVAAANANAAPALQAAGTQAPAQPVAMGDLFRSAPPANAPATPEQNFLAQNAQFQKAITTGRGASGSVISGRPVPLELSSNLLPSVPANARIVMPPSSAPASSAPAGSPAASPAGQPVQTQAPAANGAPAADTPNPIAQKMLDALNKYEQLKKQEEQEDSANQANQTAPAKVDLSL